MSWGRTIKRTLQGVAGALFLLGAGAPAVAAAAVPGCEGVVLPARPPSLGSIDAMLRNGAGEAALPGLCAALAKAGPDARTPEATALWGSLGIALLASGQPAAATAALGRSIAAASSGGWPSLEAIGWINLGNARLAMRPAESGAAADAFARAEELAEEAGAPLLVAQARLGGARAALLDGKPAQASSRSEAALASLATLPASAERARLQIAGGEILLQSAEPAASASALDAAGAAAASARERGWAREEALALDLAARAELARERPEPALTLLRAAQARAAVADAPDILFRAQRQSGQLLVRLGRPAEALDAYRGALASVERVRLDLRTADPYTGEAPLRAEVGPLYLELIELLLDQAELAASPAASHALLLETRQVLERLRTAELEDYFQDDCIAELRRLTRAVEVVGTEDTAVLYPIILPHRLFLLLTTADGVTVRKMAVDQPTLQEASHDFRFQLEARTSRRYLPIAKQLYAWLIAPIEQSLPAGLKTLVVIPDGPLRGIPFAALHDGKGFLVERLAIATAPGLSLLDSRPITAEREQALLLGLSEARQGFAPLPHVRDELRELQELIGGRVLLDEGFERPRLERSFAQTPFSIVHIASHGEFGGEPQDNFLLTFDGRLDMDALERLVKQSRFREEPVELITLSACQTAAGDDRAALGLAGIAVKAGARSALASLWSIQDESSAILMRDFYEELARGGVNKAEALQHAQASLMADPRYRHPAYWAAFMLIGNWS